MATEDRSEGICQSTPEGYTYCGLGNNYDNEMNYQSFCEDATSYCDLNPTTSLLQCYDYVPNGGSCAVGPNGDWKQKCAQGEDLVCCQTGDDDLSYKCIPESECDSSE
eukprot:Clim_evm3s60 gene=Clim_evmTU3s60